MAIIKAVSHLSIICLSLYVISGTKGFIVVSIHLLHKGLFFILLCMCSSNCILVKLLSLGGKKERKML